MSLGELTRLRGLADPWKADDQEQHGHAMSLARNWIRAGLAAAIESEGAVTATLRRELKRERRHLAAAEDQCVELIGHPDWPADKLTAKIRRLRDQQAAIDAKLTNARADQLATAQDTIDLLLRLLTEPKRIYAEATDDERQTLNRICFGKLYLDKGQFGPTVLGVEHGETAGPVIRFTRDHRETSGAALAGHAIGNDFQYDRGQDTERYVHEGGLEPPRPRAQEPKSCASASSATRANANARLSSNQCVTRLQAHLGWCG